MISQMVIYDCSSWRASLGSSKTDAQGSQKSFPPHQYFQYIMFLTNSPCSSASPFAPLACKKKKKKKFFGCECQFSREFSAQSLWLACRGLYFRGSLDHNSSLLRGPPPNSVLSVNAIKFHFNNHSTLHMDMTCVYKRTRVQVHVL